MNWTNLQIEDWNQLRSNFSWIRDMEGVPQDPIHHAEGDVAIHTRMVWQALLDSPSFQKLDGDTKQLLKAAALLHDVEKRSCTRQEADGRITAYGHAKKGAQTTRILLFEMGGIPFELREHLAGLVKYHGLPLWVLEKEDPDKSLLRAAFSVNTQLLSMLAKVDVLGRICQDQQALIERIGFFDSFCSEQNCWGHPGDFGSNAGMYKYLQGGGTARYYEPFEGESFPVVLLSGLPGMGKDTLVKDRYSDWPIISLDAIRRARGIKPGDKQGTGRVVQEAKELAKQYLRKHEPFVWNATNLNATLRAKLVGLFQSYGANTKIVYIETDYRSWLKRNRTRSNPVPQKQLEKMLFKWQVPERWEAPEVEYLVS